MAKNVGGFAEMLHANAQMSHKSASKPETGATAHHFHVSGTDSHAVVESHGPEHQVLAETQFGRGEYEELGKHLMGHLGLDDKEPQSESDKSGEAYEKEDGGGSSAGAAY